MLRMILPVFFLLASIVSNCAAAAERPKVAVMDLGEFQGAYSSNLATENVGAAVSEYITNALTKDGRFFLVNTRELDAKNLNVAGIIKPDQAREIAKILGVDYLIYGNVHGVGGDTGIFEIVRYGGGKLHKVQATLVVRMMEVQNGDIIAMARGVGDSKSSKIKIGKDTKFIKIGTENIPQVSVTNALQKAAEDAAAKLIKNFFES